MAMQAAAPAYFFEANPLTASSALARGGDIDYNYDSTRSFYA